jgi:hypothetical protein
MLKEVTFLPRTWNEHNTARAKSQGAYMDRFRVSSPYRKAISFPECAAETAQLLTTRTEEAEAIVTFATNGGLQMSLPALKLPRESGFLVFDPAVNEKQPVNAVLSKTFIGDILKARYSYGRKNQAGTAYDHKGQKDSPGSHS